MTTITVINVYQMYNNDSSNNTNMIKIKNNNNKIKNNNKNNKIKNRINNHIIHYMNIV